MQCKLNGTQLESCSRGIQGSCLGNPIAQRPVGFDLESSSYDPESDTLDRWDDLHGLAVGSRDALRVS